MDNWGYPKSADVVEIYKLYWGGKVIHYMYKYRVDRKSWRVRKNVDTLALKIDFKK